MKAIPAVTKQEVRKIRIGGKNSISKKEKTKPKKKTSCRNTMATPYVSMQEIWRE